MEDNKNTATQINQEPKQTPPTSTTSVTSITDMAARADSPYLDQQTLPGQVIGYGLPTDQKVFATPPKNAIAPSNMVHYITIGLTIFILLMVVGSYFFISS